MNPKVKESLEKVLEAFRTGEIAECVAYTAIPTPDTPSSKWSLSNRVIAWANGTVDARGFRQWKEVNRSVKKGAKAFYILAPYFKKVEDEETEEEIKLTGFFPVPVFGYEDTEGEALPEFRHIPLPPLADVAKDFGISINFAGGNRDCWGLYSHTSKAITLCAPDEHVFFHELGHAAHYRVCGDALRTAQEWRKEVVAELCACAISRIYGKRMDGNSYKYIEHYAKEAKLSAHGCCVQVLNEANEVLGEIFKHVLKKEVAA